MAPDQKTARHPTSREPIAPSNGHIAEPLYWYPNELAVTVQAAKPPTLEQLRELSARLKRVLSKIGISVVPFYSAGHCLSRADSRLDFAEPPSEAAPGEPAFIEVELEVGRTPIKEWVNAERYEQWKKDAEHKKPLNRFPGVHVFGEGPSGVAVIFYALRTHHRRLNEGRDSVQIAVDYINQHLQLLAPPKEPPPPPEDSAPKSKDNRGGVLDDLYQGVCKDDGKDDSQRKPLRVLSAVPNWLTSPLQTGGQPIGGPGAPPMDSEKFPYSGTWKFKQDVFKKLIEENKGSSEQVTVVILDTAFGDAQTVIGQAQRIPQYNNNGLLQRIVADLQNGRMTIDLSHVPLPGPEFRSGLDEYGRCCGYNMVDHGLFVAGIIRDIVPQAKIELVCIQNPYGSGDMHLFLGALQDIALHHPNLEHVVLNLSLGVMPALEELHQIWFSSCCDAPDCTEAMRLMDLLQLGVRLPIRALIEKNAVIVAAAGNDSLGKNPPNGPRIPACYDDVLGVAAVDREGEAAGFSNRANLYHWGSGIATYGGEEPNDDSETLAWYIGKSLPQGPTPDSVQGLYLNPTYPPLNADESGNRGTNTTGWAWWSGTSFATPIASGLAAHCILHGKRGQYVIKAILDGLASSNAPYEPRLQAPVLDVKEE